MWVAGFCVACSYGEHPQEAVSGAARRVRSELAGAASLRARPSSIDMFEPVFVAVVLAADGCAVHLLDLARDGPGLTELAVVDRTDRHHLGRGTREERFLRDVKVA